MIPKFVVKGEGKRGGLGDAANLCMDLSVLLDGWTTKLQVSISVVNRGLELASALLQGEATLARAGYHSVAELPAAATPSPRPHMVPAWLGQSWQRGRLALPARRPADGASQTFFKSGISPKGPSRSRGRATRESHGTCD